MSPPAPLAMALVVALVVAGGCLGDRAAAPGRVTSNDTVQPGDGQGAEVAAGLGEFALMVGAWPPQSAEPVARAADGWALLTVIEAGQGLTSAAGVHVPPADGARAVLLPVDALGVVGPAVEVVAATDVLLTVGTLVRCGDRLWGAVRSTVQAESWVFRVAPDLSGLEVAYLVATAGGGSPSAGPFVASVNAVQCAGSEAVFELRAVGGVNMALGATALPPLPGGAERHYLVNAPALFDERRFEAVGEGSVALTAVRPGAGGTVLYAAHARVSGSDGTSKRVLRHDFATGVTRAVVDVEFGPEVWALDYAEALEGPDAGRLGAVCGRYRGEVALGGGVTVADPLASDFCAVVRDGVVTTVRTFQHVSPAAVAFTGGTLWWAGVQGGADPLLGPVETASAAVLVGFDPDDMAIVARASWGVEGLSALPRAIFPVTGVGSCAGQDGVAMEVLAAEERADGLPGEAELRVLLAGPGGATCTDTVVSRVTAGTYLSSAEAGGCASGRRLALLSAGATLTAEGATTPPFEGGVKFGLVTFGPEQCTLERR